MTSKTHTYADLQQELDSVLSALQQDDIDVDEALKAYERGMQVIKQLEAVLKNAENKVIKIKKDFSA
jgi:exodeoxyribonuclease VII small subunit